MHYLSFRFDALRSAARKLVSPAWWQSLPEHIRTAPFRREFAGVVAALADAAILQTSKAPLNSKLRSASPLMKRLDITLASFLQTSVPRGEEHIRGDVIAAVEDATEQLAEMLSSTRQLAGLVQYLDSEGDKCAQQRNQILIVGIRVRRLLDAVAKFQDVPDSAALFQPWHELDQLLALFEPGALLEDREDLRDMIRRVLMSLMPELRAEEPQAERYTSITRP